MEEKTNRVKKIAVIGSGVSGLIAARFLLKEGFDCEVFEKNDLLGGVWAVGYHTFGLQEPRTSYDFPDFPMPETYPTFPSGEQIRTYLEDYMRHFGLLERINFNCTVNKLEQTTDGDWTVHMLNEKTGVTAERIFDFVVVATGLYSNPYTPTYSGKDEFQGQALHSSEYKSPQQIKEKKVVVIGFGKSALDIATDATQYANQVNLVFRQAHWPVPNYLFGLFDGRKVLVNRFASAFLPLYQRPGKWERILHHHFPWLVRTFWKLFELIVQRQYHLKECHALPPNRFEKDLFTHVFLPRDDTYPLIRQGKIQLQAASIERYTSDGIALTNGVELKTDVVIFATGWKPDCTFLPHEFSSSQGQDGMYLYRHIFHPDLKNLAFIGWASTFSNSLTSHIAIVYLTNLLKGKITLPAPEVMWREVEDMRKWKQSFMPAVSNRSAILQLHMWHYHDELLRDCGINPYRKKNFISELFQYYCPEDYRNVVNHMVPGVKWEKHLE